MRRTIILVAWAIVLSGPPVGLAPARVAWAQPLVPLGDKVDEPLVPAGVSSSAIEMSGELVHVWKSPGQGHIAQFVGDFELLLGRRRLAAKQAVVWITPHVRDGFSYVGLEVVLWREASVTEPSGTLTRGPVLYVTLNSSGRVGITASQKTFSSSANTRVFQDADRIRRTALARTPSGDTAEIPLTIVNLGDRAESPQPEPEPGVWYQARDLIIDERDGQNIVTAIGEVYLLRGGVASRDVTELRADAAVIYMAVGSKAKGLEDGGGDDRPDDRPDLSAPAGESPLRSPLGRLGGSREDLQFGAAGAVEGVYLEGDIILARGERMIRASRLYYDFKRNRALILDAVFRTIEPTRNLPIYIRAETIRQLSATEFEATDAKFTTSEFFTPHYHIGAERLTFVDRTPTDPLIGSETGLRSGVFTLKHATLNFGRLPVLYWPYIKGDTRTGETSLRSVRTGYSDDFGTEFQTKWRLFNLLGLEAPAGFDGTMFVDYFSERGPAVGVDLDYRTDDYFGLYRGYYIRDTGRDNLGGVFRDETPDTVNRGRTTLRHRQYLADDWQLTVEGSYISDKNFLEEYFEREFDQGKEQETLLYLKKQVDNWAFTSLLQYRVLDFLTTTERLPDFSFHLIGEPVGRFATLFSENRAGLVRYRSADRSWYLNLLAGGRKGGSGTVGRVDSRQELEFPLAIGPIKVVPFGSIRGTAWDDSPVDGGLTRYFGTYGVRASAYAWKIMPDVHSDLLDLRGIRHVIKADVTAWAAHSNRDSDDLYPFDETVEGIDETDGVTIGVRQRFQTRRGDPARERTVDWLTIDLELGLFNNADGDEFTNGFASYSRPENSITRNYVNASMMYRINDATALLSEVNYDLNDGEIDVFNLTYAVERTPRLSYLVGYRYIGEMDSNLLGVGLNYRISEKYTLAIREEFDLDEGKTAEFDIGFIRKFPRWYVAVTFSVDDIEDDFGMSLSAWPQGLPRAALGNRRFTGLATSTGIQPGS